MKVGPESCVAVREGRGEALTGQRVGWVLSRERKIEFGGPTASYGTEPAKGLGHGSSQPLAAVDDHQQPFRDIETPLDQ